MRYSKQFDKDTGKVTLWQLDKEGKEHFVYEDKQDKLIVRQVEPEDAYTWLTNMEDEAITKAISSKQNMDRWIERFKDVVQNLDIEEADMYLIIETRTGKFLGLAEFSLLKDADAELSVAVAKKYSNDDVIKKRLLDVLSRLINDNNLYDAVYLYNKNKPLEERIRMK